MSNYDQREQHIRNQMNAEKIINRNSYVVYIGKIVQEQERGTRRIVQMREVFLDLQLPNTSYPTKRWVERVGANGVFADQSAKVTNVFWIPEDYSYQKIKMLLMEEISKLGAEGWTLVENDIDDLWVYEVQRRKTAVSEILGEFLGVFGGLAWKYKKVYYGARFHVRRFL